MQKSSKETSLLKIYTKEELENWSENDYKDIKKWNEEKNWTAFNPDKIFNKNFFQYEDYSKEETGLLDNHKYKIYQLNLLFYLRFGDELARKKRESILAILKKIDCNQDENYSKYIKSKILILFSEIFLTEIGKKELKKLIWEIEQEKKILRKIHSKINRYIKTLLNSKKIFSGQCESTAIEEYLLEFDKYISKQGKTLNAIKKESDLIFRKIT